jgi:hypothetical protein
VTAVSRPINGGKDAEILVVSFKLGALLVIAALYFEPVSWLYTPVEPQMETQ